MSIENQAAQDSSKTIVECDLCGTENVIPKDIWYVTCANDQICKRGIVIAPVQEDKKLIRIVCRSNVFFTLISASATTYTCVCNKTHTISDLVVEIRCKQPIYNASLTVPVEDELNEANEKLSNSEKKVEELQKLNQELNEKVEKALSENVQRDRAELAKLREVKPTEERQKNNLAFNGNPALEIIIVFPWLLVTVLVAILLFK